MKRDKLNAFRWVMSCLASLFLMGTGWLYAGTVPDVRGTWTGSLMVTNTNCGNILDNGTESLPLTVTFTLQTGVDIEGAGLAMSTASVGPLTTTLTSITGTVTSGGAMTGAFPFVSNLNSDKSFISSGSGTFAGTVVGNTLTITSLKVQETVGGSCLSMGSGSVTRSGPVFPPIVIADNHHDLDGDGHTDIVWRNLNSGNVAIWLLNGLTIKQVGVPGGTPTGWRIEGISDVDGDGNADIVWRNTSNGNVAIWLMDGLTIKQVGVPGSVPFSWVIEGVGDVDGDGNADIIWGNPSTGNVAIWLMNGLTIKEVGVPGGVETSWTLEDVGDVDGDGKADIVWRNSSTGNVAIWLMNGLTIKQVGVPGSVPMSWTIEGIGDVDGDGNADIVWRNLSNGNVAIWLMNGLIIKQVAVPGGVETSWTLEDVGDVDGDGNADIVWRNTTSGAIAIWLMNGLIIQQVGMPGSVADADWQIQGGGSKAPLLFGLNFSPYLDGQDPNLQTQIPESQLNERMSIIRPYAKWIRTFGCGDGLEKSGRIAHELGFKAAIGAWLSQDLTANQQQIECLINVAKAGEADLAIVGSEALLRGDITESVLVNAINQVKQAVPVDLPVAYAEVYSQLLAHPRVVEAIDVVLVNYYPYWENMKVDLGMASIHAYHQQIIAAAKGKSIIVSETGWPSAGDIRDQAVPSLDNACFYFQNFVSWAEANTVDYFYFEAFDENWKAKEEGPQGAHWGVWDTSGMLKSCMQETLNGKRMSDNWSGLDVPGGPGTPMIEFTKVPPLGSFENLEGQVQHVNPVDHKVAVYIQVGGGWWTKPTFANPLTPIQADGHWVTDVTTGGIDERATTIIAFLVPNGFDPPTAAGSGTLPSELTQNALAEVEVTRNP